MTGYVLRLTRDQLAPAARYAPPLPAGLRVLYVLAGDLTVEAAGAPAPLAANSAWQGGGPCPARAGGAGATVLRYELARAGAPQVVSAAGSTALLEHALPLDLRAPYLMRCDRVDFDLGAEALPHRHRGGGIRCLIRGAMELRVEGEPERLIQSGQAWFESGREPVSARASSAEATSFIRCAILPREIRGQSSIMYVDPKDAGSRPRRYTVFVDEPIDLP